MSDLFDLTGKTAVVTGGNGGLGLAMARGLARAGANVAIWGRNPEKNAQALDELSKLGSDAIALQCDVSIEEEVIASTRQTLERFGAIHAGFANAGFNTGGGDPLQMSLATWRNVEATNLDGAFLTLRELAKHMVERGGGGKLVVISSISEVFGTPRAPHYAASKGGVSALARSFAVELGRHDIQVNSIQPGWIVTDATQAAADHAPMNEAITKRTPVRHWGDPADLEGIAVYFASDASRFHTGDTVRIDGGYSIF